MNAAGAPTRTHIALAAAVCAALVAYASLFPWPSRLLPWRIAWRVVVSTWPPAIGSKTDFISNILLQAPLGFLVAAAISVDRPRRRLAGVLASIACCALLALVLEMAQVSIPARSPQLTDVFAEVLGASLGALTWSAAGDSAVRIGRRWWSVSGSGTLGWLLVYAAAWAIWQCLPMDFTLRPAELALKYRSGFVTFGLGAGANRLQYIVQPVLAVALAWPLGQAARRLARAAQRRVPLAMGLACVWILAVSGAQLLVSSHQTSVVLIGAALCGGIAGTLWSDAER